MKLSQAQKAKYTIRLENYLFSYGLKLPDTSTEEGRKQYHDWLDEFIKTGKIKSVKGR